MLENIYANAWRTSVSDYSISKRFSHAAQKYEANGSWDVMMVPITELDANVEIINPKKVRVNGVTYALKACPIGGCSGNGDYYELKPIQKNDESKTY